MAGRLQDGIEMRAHNGGTYNYEFNLLYGKIVNISSS